ncbi:MAG: superoxide dismutase [Gammaproteobacteria bacterium]|nr:superoxide dismutase [Gammaproteobacteria bacterium]
MSIDLPDLPYPIDALEPDISRKTLEFHHGKHHKAYVDKLNGAIGGTDYERQVLEAIIVAAHEASDSVVFNNAAQAWNHTFLWHSMSPNGGGEPTGQLADAINERFGDLAGFQAEFKKAALGQFGSGWAWLVRTSDGLDIVTTGNADTPLTGDATPLLTLDVWEHAYYLDYQNQRDSYIDSFLQKLVNWQFAAHNYAA